MTVLQSERFQDSEEFLDSDEEKAMEGAAERPVFGNVDPVFKDQESENILAVSENSGFKYQIVNNVWTPIARKLWKQFEQLHECNPSTILFIKVSEGKSKYRGKPRIMECAVISTRWGELLEQASGKIFTHTITIYDGNVDKYEQSHNQMLVHLYNAMRQIRSDGSLRDFDIRAFGEVYANLRAGWDKEHCCIPNLIDTGNWLGMHQQQGQLFGEDRSGENAAAKEF